jgi:general secretion pathway protein H
MKNVQSISCQILRPDPKLGAQGFTLLEVIIVMVLITLVIGISTVFFANTLTSSTFNTTVQDISSSLRYARTLAQIHGERKTLTIDLDARTFTIEGKGTRKIPSHMNIKIVDPLHGEISEGKYQFIANAMGGVQGGTIVLWNEKKTVSIQPDPVVGSVVVQ